MSKQTKKFKAHTKSEENYTLRPGVNPGVSLSTMKPVNALEAGALGSGFVRARTKYLENNKNLKI